MMLWIFGNTLSDDTINLFYVLHNDELHAWGIKDELRVFQERKLMVNQTVEQIS